MPKNSTVGTPAAERAEIAVVNRFDSNLKSIGQYNRRPIAGSSTWSQHSYVNGLDFMVKGTTNAEMKKFGDPIFAFLNANRVALGIKVLLWQVKDHHNHIHVDFWSTGVGTPGLTATSVMSFKKSNGAIVKAKPQDAPLQGSYPVEQLEDDMETIKAIQEQCNAGGFKGATGNVLSVDGVLGPNTKHAMNSLAKAAAKVAAPAGITATQATVIAKNVVNASKNVAV